MRKLIEFSSEKNAHALGDYLTHSGIRSDVEEDGAGVWAVWVMDEDHMQQAQELAATFAQNPDADEIRQARGAREAEVKKQNQLEHEFNRRMIKQNPHKQGTTPVTYILIGISILFYFLQQSQDGNFQSLMFYASGYSLRLGSGESYTYYIAAWQSGEVWRLVTPIFLHFGLMHILFNMMWLHFFGRQIETVLGSRFMIALVLIVAILSNTAQFLDAGPRFGGMSGVNYGLFGYILVRRKFDPMCGLFVDKINTYILLGWFVLCFFASGAEVANMAHGGGLVVGAVWGYLAAKWRRFA